MNETDFIHETEIESEHLLPDQIYGERSLKKLEIFPRATKRWTYTLLSVFLNELPDFIKPLRRAFIVKNEDRSLRGHFTFTCKDIPKYYVIVKLDQRITVYASTSWLVNKWTSNSIAELSDYRKDKKFRVHPKLQILEFFTLKFQEMTSGTSCLYTHKPLTYCSIYDFSIIFHYFVKRIFEVGIPVKKDTCSIHEYNDLFINHLQKSISSLKSLSDSIRGYLSLDIQESASKRKLETIVHNGKTMYIIGGVYISPFAQSILRSDIKGLLLDTFQ